MYATINYRSGTDYGLGSIISVLASLACGVTDKTWLLGKVMLSSATVGITDTSTTVTWAGALTDVTCAVGQKVTGVGIPASTTIATITDGVGFTLSNAATATNAAAILALLPTATMPASTIGSTTKALAITSGSTSVTGTNYTFDRVIAVGMKVTGNGIAANTTVATVSTTSFTLSQNASSTIANATLMFEPPTALVVTAESTISTTYSSCSTWEPWDQYYAYGATAGVPNGMTLRAPISDDASNYKYLNLHATSTAQIAHAWAESVNQSTHVATNSAGQPAVWTPNKTSGGVFFVSASNNHFAFQHWSTLGWGAAGQDGLLFTERTRLAAWDTVAAAYPPVVGGTLPWTSPSPNGVRYKSSNGADLTGSSATLFYAIHGFGGSNLLSPSNASASVMQSRSPDGLGGFYYTLQPIYANHGANGFVGGELSSKCDIWVGPVTNIAPLDELLYNDKIYVAWPAYGASTGGATYSYTWVAKG